MVILTKKKNVVKEILEANSISPKDFIHIFKKRHMGAFSYNDRKILGMEMKYPCAILVENTFLILEHPPVKLEITFELKAIVSITAYPEEKGVTKGYQIIFKDGATLYLRNVK